MIRIGIIGWQEQMELLYQALLHQIKDVEILAISSEDKFFRDEAKKDGVKHIFKSPEQLYELHQLDVICIFGDVDDRLEQIEQSLKSDVDLLINYPLAGNVDDALRAKNIISRHPSQRVMVAFPKRDFIEVHKAKEAIAESVIGAIQSIKMSSTFALNETANEKGIFMDEVIKDIDVIHYITGHYISEVYATGSPKGNKIIGLSQVFINGHLDHGIPFQIESRRNNPQSSVLIEIFGDSGSISIDLIPNNGMTYTTKGTSHQTVNKSGDRYVHIFQQFLDAIRKGDRLSSVHDDSIAATKVAVACTKSYLMNTLETIEHS